MNKRYGIFKRTVMAVRDIKRMYECSFSCPACGHSANGDASSWWCSNCGASGSSS